MSQLLGLDGLLIGFGSFHGVQMQEAPLIFQVEILKDRVNENWKVTTKAGMEVLLFVHVVYSSICGLLLRVVQKGYMSKKISHGKEKSFLFYNSIIGERRFKPSSSTKG